jgi:hypothetical protein
VTWVGGALGLVLAESRRLARVARPVLLCAEAALMVVPAVFGSGVQLMWAMPRISPVILPAAMVRVAEFIRTHGSSEDLFQDSQFDRTYVIGALSERRSFVSHTMTNMPYRAEMVAARTGAIDRLMESSQPKLVLGMARAFGIRWFVLHRGNRVNWPPAIREYPALEAGTYTVYEF